MGQPYTGARQVAGEDLVAAEHCEVVKMEREEANQMNTMMRLSPSLKLQLVQERRRRLLASGDAAERQPGGTVIRERVYVCMWQQPGGTVMCGRAGGGLNDRRGLLFIEQSEQPFLSNLALFFI